MVAFLARVDLSRDAAAWVSCRLTEAVRVRCGCCSACGNLDVRSSPPSSSMLVYRSNSLTPRSSELYTEAPLEYIDEALEYMDAESREYIEESSEYIDPESRENDEEALD